MEKKIKMNSKCEICDKEFKSNNGLKNHFYVESCFLKLGSWRNTSILFKMV